MIPKLCPCCNNPVKWDETLTELICINTNCEEKLISKLVHFFTTIGIEEFGEPSIRSFFTNGYCTISDILYVRLDEIINIDGWGESSAKKLLKQFDNLEREGVSFAKLLHALDVFDGKLGEKTCQKILDVNFKISENFEADVAELCKIPDISDITAISFLIGMDFYFKKFALLPIKINQFQTPIPEAKTNKLFGQKVCFTGFRDKELENLIQENGGLISDGISKNVNVLLVKDKNSGSSKLTKAKNLGISVFYKEEFLKNFNL